MSDELKPCPFCGSVDVQIGGMIPWAECLTCGASGGHSEYANDESAIAAWNSRVEPAALQQQGEVVASEDAAIAQAFREVIGPEGGLIQNDCVVDYIMQRSKELFAHPPKPVVDAAMVERACEAVARLASANGIAVAEIEQDQIDRFRVAMRAGLEAALGVKS